MPRIQQLAQRTHQLGNVIKMQTRRGLVQHEQRTAFGQELRTRTLALGRLRQKARELEALGFATRQRGHGLPQLHILQPHIHNRLQHADHIAVGAEQIGRLADRQVQHIGHVHITALALNGHFQNLGPVTLAIAVRAT